MSSLRYLAPTRVYDASARLDSVRAVPVERSGAGERETIAETLSSGLHRSSGLIRNLAAAAQSRCCTRRWLGQSAEALFDAGTLS